MVLSTPELIRRAIRNDIFIESMLARGLINYSALARTLLPKIRKENPKAKFESILIAIQRYAMTIKKPEQIEKALKDVLAKTELVMKNDIIQITFERDRKIYESILEASKKIHLEVGEIFFLIQGSRDISMFLDQHKAQELQHLLEKTINITKGLAIISLREPSYKMKENELSRQIPGYLSALTTLLAKNNINIAEIASTHSQMIFVIWEKDLVRAYQVFDECVKYCREK